MSAKDILSLAAMFREQVIAEEDVAILQLVDAYQLIMDTLDVQLDDLLNFISTRREMGEEISIAWLRRQERLETLLDQVEQEVSRIAGHADVLIRDRQSTLIMIGQRHAEQLMLAGLSPVPAGVAVSFNRFPAGAVQQMVGFLADGSPLRDLLDELGPDASSQVRTALLRGIGTGQHPRTVARFAREALDGNLARAERIARTSMLNAYRGSTMETYRANADVVTGWQWIAALGSPRTCMSCIAKHGQVFSLQEQMIDHWNGRCTQIPVTKSWEELGVEGVPDTRPKIQTGEDWFNSLPEAKQREYMGRAKFHAWKNAEFELSDLTTERVDPVLGLMAEETSLKKILGPEKAREWYAKAAQIEREAADD